MRTAIVLLICLGPIVLSPFALTHTATSAVGKPVSMAEKATEPPRAPVFEFLGTLRVETGARTVVENGPQGTRTIVQVVGGRFGGPRIKASGEAAAGDWIH